MNETKLKDLFVSSLESGRILNNTGDSISFANPEDEIRIKNEAYFGQFDLVIAVLSRTKKQSEFGGANDFYNNVLDAFRLALKGIKLVKKERLIE